MGITAYQFRAWWQEAPNARKVGCWMIDVTGVCLPCLLSQFAPKPDPRAWNVQVVLRVVECTAVLYLVSAVPSTGLAFVGVARSNTAF